MMGGDGEILRTPFNEVPIHLWPWDFRRVLNMRRSIEGIAREIEFHPGVPPPSKRTQRSYRGMQMWREWVKVTEEKLRSRDSDKPKEAWELLHSPAFVVVFDYETRGYIAYAHRVHDYLVHPSKLLSNNPRKHEQLFPKT